MKNVKLYYFSGSGNTFKIAKGVKEIFEAKSFNCVIEKIESDKTVDLEDFEYLGLLFPVAIQSTFPLVWDFFHSLPNVKSQKVFMIDTMDAFSGGIVGPLKKLLKKKGYECVGALEVKMTNSIRTKPMDPGSVKEKNTKALMDSQKFILEMLEGQSKWASFPLISDLIRKISLSTKTWKQTSQCLSLNHDNCILCKKCIKDCPKKALSILDKKIIINYDLCMACVRCLHHCPKDAFTWKGKPVVTRKDQM